MLPNLFGIVYFLCYNVNMKYQISQNKIVLDVSPEFNIYDICHCGQLFRYFDYDSHTQIIAQNKIANVLPESNGEIVIETNDAGYFANYFDLATDYAKIKSQLKISPFLEKAMEFGAGIRILKQDYFETFFSFLVSQNNNIKRIQASLNSISRDFGEKIDGNFAFPTLEVLKNLDEKYYSSIGVGYRARYLNDFVQNYDEKSLDKIKNLSTTDARKELMSHLGVGEKVADCILLFGLGRLDVFPVDTWIDKVAREEFGLNGSRSSMASNLVEKFGNLSGYAQQYVFYYKRELTKNKEKKYE